VEGARRWYQEGLPKPDAIKEAVADWRAEMDIVAPFVDAMCIEDRETWVEKITLWNAYVRWCDEQSDHRRLDRTGFYAYLSNRGFKNGKAKNGKMRVIRGIGLRPHLPSANIVPIRAPEYLESHRA
jgi:putative DNA primase/helicase